LKEREEGSLTNYETLWRSQCCDGPKKIQRVLERKTSRTTPNQAREEKTWGAWGRRSQGRLVKRALVEKSDVLSQALEKSEGSRRRGVGSAGKGRGLTRRKMGGAMPSVGGKQP